MSNLTLGSLFDGSGGFPLGGILAGIEPVWASEIEPFPIRVTEKRLPQMKHYGDVSKLDGAELPPVDIISFGSPCQDMSIAGKRNGLDGERSGLFHQAVRIIKEMRCATNDRYPRYCVWENVPGAFSSNNGEDFQCVLEAICKIKNGSISVPRPTKWSKSGEIVGDGFSAAWRVLDACGWGVPQRRKRIYLVADFDGECAGKILFDSEGVSGYSAESFRAWQRTAASAAERIGTSGSGMSTGRHGVVLNDMGGAFMSVSDDVAGTLRAETHGHLPAVLEAAGQDAQPASVYENHSQDSRYTGPLDIAPTVAATYGMGGNNQPFVVETPKTLKIRCGGGSGGKGALIQDDLSATLACNNDQTVFQPKVYGVCSKHSNSMLSDNPHSGFYEAVTSRTIDTSDQSPCKNQGGMVVVEGNGTRPSHKGDGYAESEKMYTLNTVEVPAVAYGIERAAYNMGRNAQFNMGITEEVQPTMVAKGAGAVAQPVYTTNKGSLHTTAESDVAGTLVASDFKDPPTVSETPYYIVRRLTPQECALLQGFPTWWCSDLGSSDVSDEEVERWMGIFETFRIATGSATKPKSRNAVIKWLTNPHSDSAEYKMWGNGVALPCVFFVLSGIAYYAQSESP